MHTVTNTDGKKLFQENVAHPFIAKQIQASLSALLQPRPVMQQV